MHELYYDLFYGWVRLFPHQVGHPYCGQASGLSGSAVREGLFPVRRVTRRRLEWLGGWYPSRQAFPGLYESLCAWEWPFILPGYGGGECHPAP